MLLTGDNKKMAQAILGEVPKVEHKEVPQGLEADFSKAHEASMGEFMQAMGAQDPGKGARALKQFIKLCLKEDEYSEPEGD